MDLYLVANYPRIVSGLVHPSYKWINPTYPIYNWGYTPLTKWDRKWVITPVISGLIRSLSHVNHWGYNPLTSRGMSHQVWQYMDIIHSGCGMVWRPQHGVLKDPLKWFKSSFLVGGFSPPL